jgi:uncharacterized repeat protein (TIGR02543 family)
VRRWIALSAVALFLVSATPASAASGARPSAPRDVKALTSKSVVIVTFVAPSSSGASRIIRYDIKARPTNALYTCSNTVCTIRGLTPGAAYSFVVAAVNRFGVGPYSSSSNKVTLVATTASVTFNPNGGSGTMAQQTERINSTADLTMNSFTYTGYTFSGWNTAANGSGTSYTDGSLFTFAANTTLYAQWTISSYTVTFSANGGSGTMPSQTGNFNTTANLDPDAFTYQGYTFDGWNTASDGTGTSYADGAAYRFTSSATLYAQWMVTLVPGMQPSSISYNWAGYVVNEDVGGYQSVSGQWQVPTLNCAMTPAGDVAIWVGVNGYSGPGLFQAGTDSSCLNGQQVTYTWWTDDAQNDDEQVLSTINTGDVMQVGVSQGTSGSWSYTIKDVTSGKTLSAVESYTGEGITAEWIVEVATNTATNTLYPLADFTPVTFTKMNFTSPSGVFAPPSYSDAQEMQSMSGAVEAVPTAVLGTGSAAEFTVYYEPTD